MATNNRLALGIGPSSALGGGVEPLAAFSSREIQLPLQDPLQDPLVTTAPAASSKTNMERKRVHHRPSPQITHRARRSMRPCPCIGTRFHLLRTASKMYLLQEGACAGLKSTTGHIAPNTPPAPHGRAATTSTPHPHLGSWKHSDSAQGFPITFHGPLAHRDFPLTPPLTAWQVCSSKCETNLGIQGLARLVVGGRHTRQVKCLGVLAQHQAQHRPGGQREAGHCQRGAALSNVREDAVSLPTKGENPSGGFLDQNPRHPVYFRSVSVFVSTGLFLVATKKCLSSQCS